MLNFSYWDLASLLWGFIITLAFVALVLWDTGKFLLNKWRKK